jgi:NAD-dependent SIR2 family protein deacetylase
LPALPSLSLQHTGNYAPTPAHHFIKLLHDKGLLLCCFTQNIDSLERQVWVRVFGCGFASVFVWERCGPVPMRVGHTHNLPLLPCTAQAGLPSSAVVAAHGNFDSE